VVERREVRHVRRGAKAQGRQAQRVGDDRETRQAEGPGLAGRSVTLISRG
jgi:hypothetical protein